MDCGSAESDILESLDFLRPPVKRNTEQIFGNYFNNQPKNVQILKDFRQTLKKHLIAPKINKSAVQSSTSLILKKTSERKILEQYSIVSYTNLLHPNKNIVANHNREHNLVHTDKPLIKVTIIPKAEQVSNAKLHRHYRNSSKKIHKTASNQENSVQTKNVYLIVAGRKREKIYEIKATGSAKYFNEQITNNRKDKDVLVKELHNFKQFIKSLNMERKKKQGKKTEVKLSQEGDEVAHICKCSNTVREVKEKNIKSHRSRIRIFGRIGVTEDDKYFLNYDATVDGKPEPPNYTKIQQSLSPISLSVNKGRIFHKNLNTVGCTSGSTKNKAFRQRDSIIQADVQNYECCQLPNINWMPSKESQSTQVNFNTDLTIMKKTDTYKNHQIIQCNCSNIENNVVAVSDNESESNSLKESHSPLVIISVYPNQDTSDIINTVNCCNVENSRRPSPQRVNTSGQNSIHQMNNKNRNARCNNNANKALRTSRSPSPTARNPSKAKSQETNINKTRVYRANIRKECPDRQSVKPPVKRTLQKDNFKQDLNYKKATCFNSTKREITKNMKRNTSPTQETKSTNTEHLLAKKVLVDNYTKKVTAQMKTLKINPKNDASRVMINIDSENEFYDVLFNPGKLSTELTVRQRVKEKGSQKCYNEDNSASMQNLLYFSDEKQPKMKCCTQALCNNQPIEDMETNNHMARLDVRDSIEISHRREDKVCHNIKNVQTDSFSKRKNVCSEDMEFLAPVKHFTGDNCRISDPVERDKEIRELLGIQTIRESTLQIKKIKEQALENGNQASVHCFYHNKCDQNLVTGFSLCRLCSCNCCKQTKSSKKSDDEKGNKNNVSDEKSESSDGKDNKLVDNDDKSSEEQCVQEKCCTKRRITETTSGPQQESEETHEQLILNRNVQVFLQIDQFTKKKPIILSKKQYEKVKRAIQSTLSGKQEKRKNSCSCKYSQVSVGEVREKSRQNRNLDAGAQTEKVNKKYTKNSKDCSKIKLAIKEDEGEQVYTTAVDLPNNAGNIPKYDNYNVPARQAVSSVEIRYAKVAYTKRVTFSTTNIGAISTSSGFAKKNSHSIQTLFRGHKKSATPNLGTSVFSLLSEGGIHSDTKSVKYLMATGDAKPRKPFLKRLMSCLVLRSTRESATKIPYPTPQEPSANSSIDSYHISTSLGAIEVTSSLYDTSASFYSNHTIQPVNSKMKRGFFNSVRGFLSNRKS